MATLQPAFVAPVSADPSSPVSVVKTASANPVASGAELTYTITVTNLGSSKVDNVVMTDQVNGVGVVPVPPGLPQLTITSSKGTCTQGGPNGNLVNCNAGSLTSRQVWTVTIRGAVTAASGTTLNNTAAVTGTKSAQTFTTTGSVSVDVRGGTGGGSPLPDLTINKTGPTSVAPLSAFAYTLTINNLGTANTANVRVVDTLPVGVTFVSAATTSLFVCTLLADNRTVQCDGGAINQGQNGTITLNVSAPGTNGPITNTAVVDPDNAIAESNELNNTSASVNTAVEGPPPASLLFIAKTDGNPAVGQPWANGAGQDPVNPGEILTYKILVRNDATTRADDVRISDTTQGLEASTLIVSQTVVNGTVGVGRGCVVNAAEVICSVKSLNPTGTITMTVTGRVIAPAGSTMFNTATVNGNIKNVGLTNTASESTTVRPIIDLTITKADSPDPACARTWPTSNPNRHLANFPSNLTAPGGSIPNDPAFAPAEDGLLAAPVCLGGLTYTFVVGNSGNGPATNVVVRDPLPDGVVFDSYDSTTSFSCKLDPGNVVLCTGGSIPAAQTRELRLRVVAPPTVGSITNTVYVDPNNAIFEPDETNNTASATTNIKTGIDLVIWKGDSVSPNPPGIGAPTLIPGTSTDLADGYDPIATRGTQTYTIYVDNVGTQDVAGIRVRDTLPADTIFLSAVAYDPTHPDDPTHGFTCSHDGSSRGGVVECISGHLLGTASEFYDPAGSQIVGPDPVAPGDDFATIKIRVFARATVGTMHNEARVDPLNEIAEVNENNNLDGEDTTVGVGNAGQGAYHQLTVEKIQNSPAGDVATNGILIYDLKVSNLGTDPVSAIVVKDTLPSGTRFISAKDTDVGTSLSDAFFCSHDGSATGGVITCFGGDLSGSINKIPDEPPVGNTVPTFRTIRVKVYAPNTPATIVNVVGVDPDNQIAEGNEFDNDAALETKVRPCTPLADCIATNAFYELKITKTQTNPANPVARNGIVTYQIKVENWGSDPVSGVVVTDRLPAGFRFISAADTGGLADPDAFTCTGPDASFVVTCSGGSLDGVTGGVADFRTIEINVFAPDQPGAYFNNAFVDPNNTIPEGNEFNNQSSVSTIVANGGNRPFIDLEVDKTQIKVLDQDTPDAPGSTTIRVDTGQLIQYKLHVTNGGEGDAFNVMVRDIIPAGATYFSAADAATGAGMFTCTFSAPNIDCSGGTILAGGSRDINIFLVAPTGLDQIASDPGHIKQTITNQAFVDPFNTTPEGNESNNGDLLQTIVESQVNLLIDKKGPTGASQNETTKYTITVTNDATWGDGRTVFGVKVVDPLPVGLIPIGSVEAGGNFTCQVQENPVNTVTCTGDLAPDQAVDIVINVFITADGGTLDNEACVDPNHVIDETSELDNCKTAITGVTPSVADLAVNKTADKGTVTAGETLTYTVAVINQGNKNATGTITMNDPLPPQVTFVNANPDAGWTCTGTSTVNCTRSGLNAGATSNIKIVTTVNTGATGPFTNVATVSGNGQNPDPTGSVTTNVGGAAIDLVLSGLSDNPDAANVGQNIKYTFAVSNGGASPSGSFDITAKMDTGALSGLKFVGAAASQGFICGDIATDTVTCTGSLPAGQSTNVTIEFEVLADSPTSHTLDVRVDEANAVPESTKANNNDTETTTVTASLCTSCVDLVAGGILVTPDPVPAGSSLTRIATISNAGDISTAAAGADMATVWVILSGDDETLGTYSATAGFDCTDFDFFGAIIVECSGDLGPGEGVAVTVNSTASGVSDGDLLAATVYADPYDAFPEGSGDDHEFTDSNNSATESTDVVAP